VAADIAAELGAREAAAIGETAVIRLVDVFSLPKAPSKAWMVG
jgi:hypothetical protein